MPGEPAHVEGHEPELLGTFRLLVVTGKGGTGKSVLSATLARRLAGPSRTVWLLEADPRESLHSLVGTAPSGGRAIDAGSHLILQNLSPAHVLDDVVRQKLRLGVLARRVLSSPVYRAFVEAAPGLWETAVLGRIERLLAGRDHGSLPPPNLVVLDAPATGHGLSLLTAPRLVAETLSAGPVAAVAQTISSLVKNPADTGVVVVSTAEEMPVSETLELIEGCRRELFRPPAALFLNRLLPAGDPGSCDLPPTAARLWRERQKVEAREARRLETAWDGPLFRLPLLPEPPGPELVARLGRTFAGAWA